MFSIDDLIDCRNCIKQHYGTKSVFSDLDVWRQYNQEHSTSEFSLDKIQSILEILVKIDQVCIQNGSQYQLIDPNTKQHERIGKDLQRIRTLMREYNFVVTIAHLVNILNSRRQRLEMILNVCYTVGLVDLVESEKKIHRQYKWNLTQDILLGQLPSLKDLLFQILNQNG